MSGPSRQQTSGSDQADVRLYCDVDLRTLAARFTEVLQKAVDVRVQRAPPISTGADCSGESSSKASGTCTGDVILGAARVAILFSGGVDSAVLAALADRFTLTGFID